MSATLDENKAPRLTVDLTQVLAEMPSRLTRVEALIETMREDIGELKTGLTSLRAEMTEGFKGVAGEFKGVAAELKDVRAEMTDEFKSVRAEARSDFRWLLGLLIGLAAVTLGGFGSLWYALAKGFGWLK